MQPKRTLFRIFQLAAVLCLVSVTRSVSVTSAPFAFDRHFKGLSYAVSLRPPLLVSAPSSASAALSDRVLARLEQAESKELDPWMRDDLRIAWITVLNAQQGRSNPYVLATYQVLGIHPDKLWSAIEARRRAKLGDRYDDFFGEKSAPKKPAEVCRLVAKAKAAGAA